jgi:hypothetical protein
MAIPLLTRSQAEAKLDTYCREKVPAKLSAALRLGYSVRGNSVTMFEERPDLLRPTEWARTVVAQFRYDPQAARWSLYCADRNSRWHLYDEVGPTRDIGVLLREVEKDPTGIFWG